MGKEDILRAAVNLEEDGRDFYLKMASDAPNEFAAQTFESFADDEDNHINWINEFAEDEGITFTHTDPDEVNAIYDKLSSIFRDIPEEKRGELSVADNDTEQLNIAIGKEEESIDAYQEWADTVENSELAKLFTTLVGVEKNHRNLLENAKEYLNKTGDWFMTQEQWSFDGA